MTLRGKTVLVATHVYGTGPADALERYARERADRVIYIGHAFDYAAEVSSRVRRSQNGKRAAERVVPWHRRLPGPLTWAKDLLLTVVWGLRTRGTIDVFVGVDSLNAAAGLVLRRLRKVRVVVFWTIDYVPERFESRLLNRIYHRFDKLCVRRADVTWNVSPLMEPARRARGVTGRQEVVEIGAYARDPAASWDPHRLIFVGHLLEKQGVQLVLRALGKVRDSVPDVQLLIVGDGPFRPELERLARTLADGAVEFTGYVESHDEVERLIAESAIGLATYDPGIASFSHYADPGKVKNYLAAGVPVVMTDVVHSATVLESQHAALVVPYDDQALTTALVEVLTDARRLEELRENARRVGTRSDWTRVLDDAFAALPD